MSQTECPKCANTMGFACGTCCDCGWSYLTSEWTRVEVHLDEVKAVAFDYVMDRHARRTEETRAHRLKRREGSHQERTALA